MQSIHLWKVSVNVVSSPWLDPSLEGACRGWGWGRQVKLLCAATWCLKFSLHHSAQPPGPQAQGAQERGGEEALRHQVVPGWGLGVTMEGKAVWKVGEAWVGHGESTGRTGRGDRGGGALWFKGSIRPEKGDTWETVICRDRGLASS